MNTWKCLGIIPGKDQRTCRVSGVNAMSGPWKASALAIILSLGPLIHFLQGFWRASGELLG